MTLSSCPRMPSSALCKPQPAAATHSLPRIAAVHVASPLSCTPSFTALVHVTQTDVTCVRHRVPCASCDLGCLTNV
jgi:hypothetical protein